MANALDSKSSPSNRVSVQVRSPVLLNTKGLAVVSASPFWLSKTASSTKRFLSPTTIDYEMVVNLCLFLSLPSRSVI